MAIHIKADGTEQFIEPQRKNKFTLEELQKLVGGYIEVLKIESTPEGNRMIVNEEGKLHKLPVNEKASLIYRRDAIVGDVVILSHKQIQ